MRKEVIGAVSAIALLAGGAAFAQQQPPAPADQPPGASPGQSAEQQAGEGIAMGRASASQLLGKTVVGSDGQQLGEVEDVILDPQSGQAKQIVISSGGFLGIGEKQIAVEFQNLQMQPGADQVAVSNLTQQDVDGLPEYEYSSDTVSLNREGGSDQQQPPTSAGSSAPPPAASGSSAPPPPSGAPGGQSQ
ncbi:MAG TPA: PRC-barrel domain-containing protein [Azospirillaceae bacterium]|nr:PRC-barrel domain-containing protein [Azospirillaceae bacterium]